MNFSCVSSPVGALLGQPQEKNTPPKAGISSFQEIVAWRTAWLMLPVLKIWTHLSSGKSTVTWKRKCLTLSKPDVWTHGTYTLEKLRGGCVTDRNLSESIAWSFHNSGPFWNSGLHKNLQAAFYPERCAIQTPPSPVTSDVSPAFGFCS